MKRIAQVISYLALTATLLSAVLFFADQIELPLAKVWMLAAALVWFAVTPFWMEHKATD
ncbi:MAG TPA: hypothetical protein P5205_01045 [Candidatus Paceibacterota bacterium]|nr:hypothetical protein [Verrucomicrobiota bacterium]HSA08936.1 hypothetical protein [Candidatus Paceibacterota bacterium]